MKTPSLVLFLESFYEIHNSPRDYRIFQFKSLCRRTFIVHFSFRKVLNFPQHSFKNIDLKKYISCTTVLRNAEERRKQENRRRELVIRSSLSLSLCRKNNGSFNYRIDCLEFLSPGAILPFHPFFPSAPCFFFRYFSICLPIYKTK